MFDRSAGHRRLLARRSVRASLKIPRGPVFVGKVGWQGVTKENIPGGSSTEEQRSQPAFPAKTRRASALLSSAGVGSVLTAHRGDARTSPPWHTPKSLSSGPLAIFRQALSVHSFRDEAPKPGNTSDKIWRRDFSDFLKATLSRASTLIIQPASVRWLTPIQTSSPCSPRTVSQHP